MQLDSSQLARESGLYSFIAMLVDSHVLNSWTRMPGIREQLAFPASITSNLIVTRALLKPGRAYQEAVDSFSQHDRVREVDEDIRGALREIMDIARVDGRPPSCSSTTGWKVIRR